MPEPSTAEEKPAPEQVTEDAPKSGGIPKGLKALFISGPTQQIFQCVTDSDVSEESPFKLIPKAAILEDFRNRAAISDFHPVKKTVQVNRSYVSEGHVCSSLIFYSWHNLNCYFVGAMSIGPSCFACCMHCSVALHPLCATDSQFLNSLQGTSQCA